MAWTPSNTSLKTVDQLPVYTNYSQTFSYVDPDPLTDYAVTGIVADKTNALMDVGVNNISGQYDAQPHGGSSITYLNKNKTYNTVTNFNDITNSYEICSFTAPTVQTVTYSYTVTAKDKNLIGPDVQQVYTVVSTFNWDIGKTALLNAIAQTRIGR
jgi:hypothetical protein